MSTRQSRYLPSEIKSTPPLHRKCTATHKYFLRQILKRFGYLKTQTLDKRITKKTPTSLKSCVWETRSHLHRSSPVPKFARKLQFQLTFESPKYSIAHKHIASVSKDKMNPLNKTQFGNQSIVYNAIAELTERRRSTGSFPSEKF